MVMTKTDLTQWLAAVLLIVSGILLLCAHSTAQVKTALLTRSTVDGRVAQAFDLAGIENTMGCPALRAFLFRPMTSFT
jgi:hypothetical protein